MKWVVIAALLLTALAGVAFFSKSIQKGENYVSLDAKAEAQRSGKDSCDILLEWLAEAKQLENTQKVRDIQKAQKFLGCRNIQKRGERKLMSWYAAHTIMYVKYKDGSQDSYPFWENIILLEADSDDEATAKAKTRAQEDEGDSNGTFTWSGRPAQWCFGGIRKIVTCEDPESKPGDGTEITYLEMEVDDEEGFAKLISGEPVEVRYG
jgi:hypothetical protein